MSSFTENAASDTASSFAAQTQLPPAQQASANRKRPFEDEGEDARRASPYAPELAARLASHRDTSTPPATLATSAASDQTSSVKAEDIVDAVVLPSTSETSLETENKLLKEKLHKERENFEELTRRMTELEKGYNQALDIHSQQAAERDEKLQHTLQEQQVKNRELEMTWRARLMESESNSSQRLKEQTDALKAQLAALRESKAEIKPSGQAGDRTMTEPTARLGPDNDAIEEKAVLQRKLNSLSQDLEYMRDAYGKASSAAAEMRGTINELEAAAAEHKANFDAQLAERKQINKADMEQQLRRLAALQQQELLELRRTVWKLQQEGHADLYEPPSLSTRAHHGSHSLLSAAAAGASGRAALHANDDPASRASIAALGRALNKLLEESERQRGAVRESSRPPSDYTSLHVPTLSSLR